jgi:hypothetical protein
MNLLTVLLDSTTDRQGKIVGAILIVVAIAAFTAFKGKKKDEEKPE